MGLWCLGGADGTRDRAFLNQVFNFLGLGLSLYVIAMVYTWVSGDGVVKRTVKCRYCRKRISEKVRFLIFFFLEIKGVLRG